LWGLSLVVHDRDDAAGTAIPDQMWPAQADALRPLTWGQLRFGIPGYVAPAVTPRGTVEIRHGLDGQVVADADIGGSAENQCRGEEDHIWSQWGTANWGHAGQINIQNQSDVGDWPCFGKFYMKFPLDSVPKGKQIISATLTLHQFGQAGEPGKALPSLIQASITSTDWNETQLSWNNAPQAIENVSSLWVKPIGENEWPGWPGVPRTWDVSAAVAQAYQAGKPISIALYESDEAYHSGKYFVSSQAGDWNAVGRPTLRVTFGD
jgi:hypothetical protein